MPNDEKEVKLPPINDAFSFSIRFNIMLILLVHKKITFSKLQKLLNLSSGNLNHHLNKLLENNFISINKMIFSTRPMNIIYITKKGEESFSDYLIKFKKILKDINI